MLMLQGAGWRRLGFLQAHQLSPLLCQGEDGQCCFHFKSQPGGSQHGRRHRHLGGRLQVEATSNETWNVKVKLSV